MRCFAFNLLLNNNNEATTQIYFLKKAKISAISSGDFRQPETRKSSTADVLFVDHLHWASRALQVPYPSFHPSIIHPLSCTGSQDANNHEHSQPACVWAVEGAGAPRGNPHRHEENIETPHRKYWEQSSITDNQPPHPVKKQRNKSKLILGLYNKSL